MDAGADACWFADRTVRVRRKYGLTIDRREAEAVERVLAACPSTNMVVSCSGSVSETHRDQAGGSGNDSDGPLARFDNNGNGRITCAEARCHGIAPVPRGHPAYGFMRDADGDGVVCE